VDESPARSTSASAGGSAPRSKRTRTRSTFSLHLLFTRHGISLANVLDAITEEPSGNRPTYIMLDAPLVKDAETMARDAGTHVLEYIEGLGDDVFKAAIVSSVLTRAQQTAYYQFFDPWINKPLTSMVPKMFLVPFIREEGSSVTLNNIPYDYSELSSGKDTALKGMNIKFGKSSDSWTLTADSPNKNETEQKLQQLQKLINWRWDAGVEINKDLLGMGGPEGLWGPQSIQRFIDEVMFREESDQSISGFLQQLLGEVDATENIHNKHMIIAVVTHSNVMAMKDFFCRDLWEKPKPLNNQVVDLKFRIEAETDAQTRKYKFVGKDRGECVMVVPAEKLRSAVVTEEEMKDPKEFMTLVGPVGVQTLQAVIDYAQKTAGWAPKEKPPNEPKVFVQREEWESVKKAAARKA